MDLPPDLPTPSAMAELAAEAYQGPWRWICGDVKVIDRHIGPWRVIGFRGTTKDGLDILRDMRCFPLWSRRRGFGPAGFDRGAMAVAAEIYLDCAEDIKAGRLIIIGHSLGASMGGRLAVDLAALDKPPVALYLLEPARFLSPKGRRLLRDRRIRLIFTSRDGDDPVPRVPFLYRLPPNVTEIGDMPHLSSIQVLSAVIFRFGWVVTDALRRHRIAVVTERLKALGL